MIELIDLTIHAGDFSLENVSLEIPASAYAVLMGRTGRGKTTILEAICGLRSIHSGQIIVDNTDVTNWMPGDRQIGYVPQDLALFPTLTVEQHLTFALKLRKYSAEAIGQRCTELAEMLGISHLRGRSIQDLSGGESQRVALGRALSFYPSVLLLDEPLSALDESTRMEMQDVLRTVKRSTGVTTLHVTHSNEEAEALADHRFELNDGVVSKT